MNFLSLDSAGSKKVLVFPFDLMSHYLRCIVLAKRHPDKEFLFAASEQYTSFVQDNGFSTFQVEHFNADAVMEHAREFSFAWLNQATIERVFLSQYNAIVEHKADMVIGDVAPGLKMAAERAGVTYLALMNGYMTKYYAYTRKLSRTHRAYNKLQKLPPKVSEKITGVAEKIAFRVVHQPFKKLRRKHNLKKISNYIDEMEGDLNLICDDLQLYPQSNLPVAYTEVGPLVYHDTTQEDALMKDLEPEKPLLCVCMGSSGDWSRLAFLRETKYAKFNVVAAGDTKEVLAAAHVNSRPFVNLDLLLPHAALMICHGGSGTVYHALKHNVPILCLTSHFEQEWVVQGLERNNLGKSLDGLSEFEMEKVIESTLGKAKGKSSVATAIGLTRSKSSTVHLSTSISQEG